MIGRRAMLLATSSALLSCTRHSSSSSSDNAIAESDVELRDWSFPGAAADGGSERTVVLIPRAPTGTKFPVLIALHGRGEAVRGAEVGAYGWVREYGLRETWKALVDQRLDDAAFQGFVDHDRVAAERRDLAAKPFGGLIVVCPHTPDLLHGSPSLDSADRFGAFVESVLLPKVRAECPASDAIGIDGVSLGGRVSLLVGLARPSVFSAVGTLQPAIHIEEASALADRAESFLKARSTAKLRLLTSDADPFKPAVAALHQAFDARHLPHEHVVVVGPHDYSFNRGPGGIEMLFWHDRVLRGLAGL